MRIKLLSLSTILKAILTVSIALVASSSLAIEQHTLTLQVINEVDADIQILSANGNIDTSAFDSRQIISSMTTNQGASGRIWFRFQDPNDPNRLAVYILNFTDAGTYNNHFSFGKYNDTGVGNLYAEFSDKQWDGTSDKFITVTLKSLDKQKVPDAAAKASMTVHNNTEYSLIPLMTGGQSGYWGSIEITDSTIKPGQTSEINYYSTSKGEFNDELLFIIGDPSEKTAYSSLGIHTYLENCCVAEENIFMTSVNDQGRIWHPDYPYHHRYLGEYTVKLDTTKWDGKHDIDLNVTIEKVKAPR